MRPDETCTSAIFWPTVGRLQDCGSTGIQSCDDVSSVKVSQSDPSRASRCHLGTLRIRLLRLAPFVRVCFRESRHKSKSHASIEYNSLKQVLLRAIWVQRHIPLGTMAASLIVAHFMVDHATGTICNVATAAHSRFCNLRAY